jgi:hypothetical protein
MAYADDVNLLGYNTETSIDASKEVGLKVNAEKHSRWRLLYD